MNNINDLILPQGLRSGEPGVRFVSISRHVPNDPESPNVIRGYVVFVIDNDAWEVPYNAYEPTGELWYTGPPIPYVGDMIFDDKRKELTHINGYELPPIRKSQE